MNRQQRRAAERKQAAVPMVKMGLLTLPEAEVLAEALDAYTVHLGDLGDLEGPQVWALGRARAMRDMLQASLENRPGYDSHAERAG